MRRWFLLLACAAACGAPAATRPSSSAAPTPTLAPAPSLPPASSPAPLLPPASASTSASCALTDVTLPVHPAPALCSPPSAREYAGESDLDVDAKPVPSSAPRGASIEFTVTMKNVTRLPLVLHLTESQTMTFTVSREGDPNAGPTEVIEPPPEPTVSLPASCAHVSGDPPFMMVPEPRPPPASITLAPGGMAHARVTWQPHRWVVPRPKVDGCRIERLPPVASGPLGPGGYAVILSLPFEGADAASPPFARADVGIAP